MGLQEEYDERIDIALVDLTVSTPAIGTPQQIVALIANATSGAANSTTQDTPPGSLIVVIVSTWASTNGTVTSVTDSAGNSYTLAVQRAAAAGEPYPCAIFYSSNTPHDLPAGGTITVTNSGGTTQDVGAWSVTGANGGLDATNTTSQAGVTGVTLSSGALGASSEIVFAALATTGNLAGYAPNAPFTELFFGFTGSQNAAGMAYDIVSSNASVSYAPTWTNNITVSSVLASFKAG